MILQHVFRKWNHWISSNVIASRSSGYKEGFCVVTSYSLVGICRSFGGKLRSYLRHTIISLFWRWKQQGSSKQWQISVSCVASYPSRQTSDMPVTKMQIQQFNQPALQPTLIEWNVILQDKDPTQRRPQCWHATSSSVSHCLIKFPTPSVR
jgi:hypothetical protein